MLPKRSCKCSCQTPWVSGCEQHGVSGHVGCTDQIDGVVVVTESLFKVHVHHGIIQIFRRNYNDRFAVPETDHCQTNFWRPEEVGHECAKGLCKREVNPSKAKRGRGIHAIKLLITDGLFDAGDQRLDCGQAPSSWRPAREAVQRVRPIKQNIAKMKSC